MKICSKCKIEKYEKDFCKDKRLKNGISSICKKCHNNISLDWQKNNPQTVYNKRKRFLKLNPNYNKEKSIEFQQKNPKYFSKKGKEFRKKNPNYHNDYINNRIKIDKEFKILKNLRNRIQMAILSQSSIKAYKSIELLGCTGKEAAEHLESLFQEGMTWNNYGKFGWHIDHIKPCTSFDLTNPEEQKECFHYTNLQPLWAEENFKKGSKYE